MILLFSHSTFRFYFSSVFISLAAHFFGDVGDYSGCCCYSWSIKRVCPKAKVQIRIQFSLTRNAEYIWNNRKNKEERKHFFAHTTTKKNNNNERGNALMFQWFLQFDKVIAICPFDHMDILIWFGLVWFVYLFICWWIFY